MKKLNIVLDIDGTLATNEGDVVKKYLPQAAQEQLHDNFIDVCFAYEGTQYSILHFLMPGCIELIQAILDIPNVNLVFFSHGVEPRNKDLVKKIMQKINTKNPKHSFDDVSIFSRQHCVDTRLYKRCIEPNAKEVFQPRFLEMYGNHKKDLRLITWSEEKYNYLLEQAFQNLEVLAPNPTEDQAILNNTILIDDDYSIVYREQEKNLLKAPWFMANSFHNFEKLGIENPDKLKKIIKMGGSDNFSRINNLFYVAGLLFKVLEVANGAYDNIINILWELQIKNCKIETENYGQYLCKTIMWNVRPEEDLVYYLNGMEVLKKYNPSIELISVKK